jgi:hypothetical protein
MSPKDGLAYLVGQRAAILRLAEDGGTLPTGVFLVLLTAIARNYDQQFILEQPWAWLFGPLLFSLVSGTWLCAVSYALLARRRLIHPPEARPKGWEGWVSFMGLFWMTAPIAWLYALPVERFLSSLDAAKANLALLAVVSLWRVLLMARVLQVACRAPFVAALVWVLLPAAVEVIVVYIFGGGFARAVMAAMAGLRNSPEEELVWRAMGNAFVGAIGVGVLALVLSAIIDPREEGAALPTVSKLTPGQVPWGALGVATLCWGAIAVEPQMELSRNLEVERRVSAGRMRDALDFLGSRQPSDFAPARPLPPRPYEREVFEQLPFLIGSVRATDPAWVRQHLVKRLNEMTSHFALPRWAEHAKDPTRDELRQNIQSVLSRFRVEPVDLVELVDGLQRFEEGRAWWRTNDLFQEALAEQAQQGDSWTNLATRLRELGVTNAPTTGKATNKPGVAPTE